MIRFEKNINMHKYFYNMLNNIRGWVYSVNGGEKSCKAAIEYIKNDFTKNYKDYI